MMNPQDCRFWSDSLRAGLLDEAALLACWESIEPERRTPEQADQRLARRAVEDGRLTHWQAKRLLGGRATGFFIDHRYVLLDLLGQGGMGRVYLARDLRLNRPVALKVLSSKGRSNPMALARFHREAIVGARLQHDHLVRIYDEGEDHGIPYLVMEYIEGQPLGRLLSEFGPMPPATASRLARQVALGLEHLRIQGMVHRDINPWNILVTPDGIAKITDLGLALDPIDQAVLTIDGSTLGTFDYMSPEQARHSRKIDCRSDLYALGCTLYQMVTGRLPFERATLPEKLLAHLSEEPIPPHALAADLPEGLEAVILKLLRKSPEERYPTPLAVVEALDPFSGARWTTISLSRAFEAIAPTQSISAEAIDTEFPLPSSTGSDEHSVETLTKLDPGPGSWSFGRPSAGRLLSRIRGASASPLAVSAWASASALVLVALLWVAWPPGTWPASPEPSPPGDDAPPSPSAGPMTIRILRADGSSATAGDLDEALDLAGPGDVRIELGGSGPVRLERSGPLEIVRGSVTIVAAPGARPELVPVVFGSRPFFRVRPRALLRLEGLTIRAESFERLDEPPPLIDSSGRLELVRCAFRADGPASGARAVALDGPSLVASGCWFEGFCPTLDLAAFAGFDARLEHCMVIGRRSGAPESSGAIRVDRATNALPDASRRLLIQDCTIQSPCLLRADEFSPDSPLTVVIERTRVMARGLVSWQSPSEPTIESLAWSGRRNWYELPESFLLDRRPRGPTVPPRPIGWEEWTRIWEESGTTLRPAPPLTPRPTSNGPDLQPEDYPRVGTGEDVVGADPERVGPEQPGG